MENNNPQILATPQPETPKKFSKKGIAVLAIAMVILGTATYFAQKQGEVFQASVISTTGTTAVPGDKSDPLLTSVVCSDRDTVTLKVSGGAGGPSDYDWYATRSGDNGPIAVLKNPVTNSVPASQHIAVGNTIQVVKPDTAALGNANQIFVNALPTGASSGGVTFTIDTAPACVKTVEFVDPVATQPIDPKTSPVTIKKIKATMTNGLSYLYDLTTLKPEVIFKLYTSEATSSLVSKVIDIPTQVGTGAKIDMEVSGQDIAPIHIPSLQDTYALINDTDAGDPDDGTFKLASANVYQNTLAVYETTAGSCITPGDYLIPGVDYTFNNGTPDSFTITAADNALCVAYDYQNPTPLTALLPIPLTSTSCVDHVTSIVQGTGTGFDFTDPESMITLDPELSIDETRIVYLKGGTGSTVWRSSNEEVLTIKQLSEASQEDPLTNADLNMNYSLTGSGQTPNHFVLPTTPIAFVNNCTYKEVGNNDVLDKCDVTISAQIKIKDFDQNVYPITIRRDLGTVTGSGEMTGILTGTLEGVTAASSGNLITAEGNLTGIVTGDANGPVQAAIKMEVLIGSIQNEGSIDLEDTTISSISGTLVKTTELQPAYDQPISSQNGDISTYSILKGIKPGQATITATDSSNCTVLYDIQVLDKQLTLQFENNLSSISLAPAGSARLRAFDAGNDITAQVTFKSSNEEVATVDASGLVTALSSGKTLITATAPGFPTTGGSQSIAEVNVAQIKGLTISLDKDSFARLSLAERQAAHKSVVLAINTASAAGQTVTVEGTTFTLTGATPGTIATALAAAINGSLSTTVSANVNTTYPGVITLVAKNTNTAVDITSTARSEDVTILPILSELMLPIAESFGVEVLGEYDDNSTRRLGLRDFTLAVDPINRLDDKALEAGRLEVGIEPGRSSLFAEAKVGNSKITSNRINVNVSAGPVIEFVRVQGSATLVRGGRITLSTKLVDVHAISDIKEIKASLVRSTATTVEGIKNDPSAVWFTAQTFKDLIVEEKPAQTSTGTPQDETDETAAEAEISTLTYRTYSLPIEIPQDAKMIDGQYQLLLEITDTANHVSSFALGVTIGAVVQGDVSGDGKISMVDVVLGYRIMTGALQGTSRQIEALDLDKNGKINITDVILLFRKVNNPAA